MADRKKWKDIVRQAKAHKWAVMPMEEEENYTMELCTAVTAHYVIQSSDMSRCTVTTLRLN